MSEPKEVVEQGVDSQIVRRFIEYDSATGAYKMEYHRCQLMRPTKVRSCLHRAIDSIVDGGEIRVCSIDPVRS